MYISQHCAYTSAIAATIADRAPPRSASRSRCPRRRLQRHGHALAHEVVGHRLGEVEPLAHGSCGGQQLVGTKFQQAHQTLLRGRPAERTEQWRSVRCRIWTSGISARSATWSVPRRTRQGARRITHGRGRQVGRAAARRRRRGSPNPSKAAHVVELRGVAQRVELSDPLSTRWSRPARASRSTRGGGSIAVDSSMSRWQTSTIVDSTRTRTRTKNSSTCRRESTTSAPCGPSRRPHPPSCCGCCDRRRLVRGTSRSPRPADSDRNSDGYANHLRKAREWSRESHRKPPTRGIDDVPAHVGRPHDDLGEDLRRVVLGHLHSTAIS